MTQDDPASWRPEAFYQALLEGLPDGVLVSQEGSSHYQHANVAAERLLGYSREELLSLGPADLTVPEELPRLAEIGRALRRRGEWRGERRLRRKDGTVIPVEITTTQIVLGGRKLFQGLLRDVTERKRAEEIQRFLVEASAVLASSLDYEVTLANVARLAVPTLADWCTINRLDDDGSIRRIEMVHRDPARRPLIEALQRYRAAASSEHSRVNSVLRGGISELVPEVPESYIRAIASDAEHERILRELDFASLICVPLLARGRALGAMSFVAGESRPRYGARDLTIAEDLARRAALAIDNALLYRAVQRDLANHEALLRLVRQFAAEATPERVLQDLLEGAAGMVDSDGVTLYRWDEARRGLVPMARTAGAVSGIEFVPPGQGCVGRAIELGKPFFINDYQRAASPVPAALRAGMTGVLSVPLFSEGRLIGALSVGTYRADRRFTEDDARALELLAGIATATIDSLERAQLRAVTLAARELAHRLNNNLAVAVGTIELLRADPDLPVGLHDLVDQSSEALLAADQHIRQFQQLARIQTKDTPIGPTLDLERST